jgi:cell filamentation protein
MLTEGAIGVHDVDVHAIRQHLFADVYPWAGNYRVTELRRGDSVFA